MGAPFPPYEEIVTPGDDFAGAGPDPRRDRMSEEMPGSRAARRLAALVATAGVLVAAAQGGACGSFTAQEAASDAGGEGGAKAYVTAVSTDVPLAHWRLDEDKGAIAHSTVGGSTYEGSIRGGAMLGAPGAVAGGTALKFTKEGQVVDVGATFDFPGVAPFSLEAWVDLTTIDGDYRHVFIKDSMGGAPREEYGIYVRRADTPTIAFERFVGGKSMTAEYASPSGAAPELTGGWHHVVGTYDGSVLHLYLDGAAIAKADDTRSQASKTGAFLFGSKAPGFGTLLGAIDEVAVYDHALTEARVMAHYAAAVNGR